MSISVVIPAYNRAKLLPLTLRSLLRQTAPADEIIVVDDGSTDGTAEVVDSFGGTVRVIRQANGGPAAARNTGFRASRGEFIHFFDSDDVALPNKHEVQLRALETSGADIAYGPWVKGRFTPSSFEPEDLILQQQGLPDGDLVRRLLCDWSVVPHACLFRRSIVERAGGFPEDLFGTEDQMMFLNCLLAGAKVVHSPGTLELYRNDNVGKITDANNGGARHIREWGRFLLAAEQACSGSGIDALNWFGFRRRIWESCEDLASAGLEKEPWVAELTVRLEGRPGRGWYGIHRAVERKWRGFQARAGNGRAARSFRAGKMDPMQQIAMQQWLDSNGSHQ